MTFRDRFLLEFIDFQWVSKSNVCLIGYCIVKVGSDRAARSHTAHRHVRGIFAKCRDCLRSRFAPPGVSLRPLQWRYDLYQRAVRCSNFVTNHAVHSLNLRVPMKLFYFVLPLIHSNNEIKYVHHTSTNLCCESLIPMPFYIWTSLKLINIQSLLFFYN